jgi:predicted nucleotidyltransferase
MQQTRRRTLPATVKPYITKLRRNKRSLSTNYGIKSLGIFGSYVRGEQRRGSDLDVLVSFSEVPSMLGFIRLERHLSEILGIKVDLVIEDSLKPRVGDRILSEVVRI